MLGLGAAALLARRLLFNLGLERFALDATCSPQVFPGPLADSASSREVAGGHFSWDNLTLQVEGGSGSREEGGGGGGDVVGHHHLLHRVAHWHQAWVSKQLS